MNSNVLLRSAVQLPLSEHGIPQLQLLLTLILAVLKVIVVCIGLFFAFLAIIILLVFAFAGIAKKLRAIPSVC